MGRAKKFSFSKILMDAPEPEERNESVLSIYKSGQMIISKATVLNHGLSGAFVDILWDPERRALGFRKMNGITLPENEWQKTYRLFQVDPKTGQIKVAVGRILKKIGLWGYDYKKLPLEKYLDIMESQEIYYVTIPKGKKNESMA